MKKVKLMTLGALLVMSSITACKKSNDKPASTNNQLTFTLNGDGFNNQNFSLTAANGLANGSGFYFVANKFTGLAANNSKTSNTNAVKAFALAVDGQKTGPQNFGAVLAVGSDNSKQVELVLSVDQNGAPKLYDSIGVDADGNDITPVGSVNITQYGAVGSNIEGTFSGTLVNAVDGKTVEISNGHFVLTRIADKPADQ